jgi:starch synthase (maltosyl-transferring)
MSDESGRTRVVIQNISPDIDAGRFPCKRIVGDRVVVQADVFADGHDELQCLLLYGQENQPRWQGQVPMQPLGNDVWRAEFTVAEVGMYRFAIRGWVDHFLTWRRDLEKRLQAGQDVSVEMLIGGRLVEQAARRAADADATHLMRMARTLLDDGPVEAKIRLAQQDELLALMKRYPDTRLATDSDPPRRIIVDREKARFSAWYEMFPRSWGFQKGRHATLRDCEARLPYIAGMGFDVLYLPPVHPIGRTFRKGKNNTATCTPDEPGSPWGIGSSEGGHKAVHSQLGTLADFRRLLARAREFNLEIALDIAFQCSPDHPYVKEHPEWFRKRPDGTVQYAENPPKKYQDIYPLDFECDDWRSLWQELKSIFFFWIEQGVRIFRVDNPHTKPFAFWEWVIAAVKKDYPDVIFLSEAFTRPKIMYRLAKLGFTQSYTYFTWRNYKQELTDYFTELTQSEVREFFHPSLWPNTPDILSEVLQHGGRPAFQMRLVLAATLGANFGIYGPAYELCVNQAYAPGSEEYLNSEKYEIKAWDFDRADSLRDFITRVNRIRREHPALHADPNLRFHPVDNNQLLCYSKHTEDWSNVILVVVNLDPRQTQSGWVSLPLHDMRINPDQDYQVHDLLSDATYVWHGGHNFVELNPDVVPAHIFLIGRRKR